MVNVNKKLWFKPAFLDGTKHYFDWASICPVRKVFSRLPESKSDYPYIISIISVISYDIEWCIALKKKPWFFIPPLLVSPSCYSSKAPENQLAGPNAIVGEDHQGDGEVVLVRKRGFF